MKLLINNKRGEPNAFLISVIIILVTLLILFIWLYKSGYLLARDSDFRLCQLTIQAQDKTKNMNLDSPLTINCDRRFLKIEEHTTMQYNPDNKLSISRPITVYLPKKDGALMPTASYNELDKTVVTSVFAESMRRCWEMVGEGKTSIFNDQQWAFSANTCLICDQIEVGGTQTFAKDAAPLLSQTLARTMPNTDPALSYAEYLFTPTAFGEDEDRTLSGGKICLAAYQIDEDFSIEPGTYATVAFHSTKQFKLFSKIGNFLRLNSDGSYECQNVYVVPASKLRSLCEYVAN